LRQVVSRDPLVTRAKAWFLARLSGDLATRIALAVTLFFVLGGLYFRARGYLFRAPAFWLDECLWAMNLTERPLTDNQIRPPGFILVSRWLALAFGPTESVLRALPWLTSCAALLAAPFLARRLYGSTAARILFVAAVAANACLIDFAKEFKPYSSGFALHLALLLLALRYVEAQRPKDLAATLATAGIGVFFSQDLVFAYPGLFLVIGHEALTRRREHLRPIVLTAALIIAALLAQYLLLWRHMPKDGASYWGAKYNVFYTAQQPKPYLAWLFERYREMAEFPGVRRDHWDGWGHDERVRFRVLDRGVWLALHVGGLAVLAWRRRIREALLLVLPLVLVLVFNVIKVWPIGPFRSDIFTLVYFSAIAAMSLDGFARDRPRWYSALPALVVVALPLFVFERVWHARKQYLTYDSKFPAIIGRLLSARNVGDGELEPVILDRRSCEPWRFYTQFHPQTKLLRPRLEARYSVRCLKDDTRMGAELLASASSERPEWIVLHTGHRIAQVLRQPALSVLDRLGRWEIGPHSLMEFRRRFTAPARPNERRTGADRDDDGSPDDDELAPDND
jgi:hypothetical protein